VWGQAPGCGRCAGRRGRSRRCGDRPLPPGAQLPHFFFFPRLPSAAHPPAPAVHAASRGWRRRWPQAALLLPAAAPPFTPSRAHPLPAAPPRWRGCRSSSPSSPSPSSCAARSAPPCTGRPACRGAAPLGRVAAVAEQGFLAGELLHRALLPAPSAPAPCSGPALPPWPPPPPPPRRGAGAAPGASPAAAASRARGCAARLRFFFSFPLFLRLMQRTLRCCPAAGQPRGRAGRAGGRGARPPTLTPPPRGAPRARDLPAGTAIVVAPPRRAFAATSRGVCATLLELLQRKAPAAEFKRPNQFRRALLHLPPIYPIIHDARSARAPPPARFLSARDLARDRDSRSPRALDGSARALAITFRHPLQSEWRPPRWSSVSFRGRAAIWCRSAIFLNGGVRVARAGPPRLA
jgi:hypothetical protein